MSRASVLKPPTYNLINFIGDTHFGDISTGKSDKMAADLTHPLVPRPRLHFQVGDLADDGSSSSQRTTALAWMNGLDTPWKCAIGNHDIVGNAIAPNTVAAAYGMSAATYTYDVEFARLIVLGPVPFWDLGSLPAAIGVSQTTLDYLTARLNDAPAGLPCLIVCHAPLSGTVAGGSTVGYPSTGAEYHVTGPNLTDDSEVRAVLNAHSNAKAWICGHTHTQLDTAGLFTTVNVGSRSIAHINCSSPHYTGGLSSPPPTDAYKKQWGAITSLYVNVYSDHLDVRVRDHGAGVWTGPNGVRTTTLTPS